MSRQAPDPVHTVNEASWASCLVIVTAYDDAAPAAAAAVRQAAARMLLILAVDDFIELRFVPVGPRPTNDEHESAVERIVDAMTSPTRGAPENHFGLVVADDAEAGVAALLATCAAAMDGGGSARPLRPTVGARGLSQLW
jgi:hypothetical protein